MPTSGCALAIAFATATRYGNPPSFGFPIHPHPSSEPIISEPYRITMCEPSSGPSDSETAGSIGFFGLQALAATMPETAATRMRVRTQRRRWTAAPVHARTPVFKREGAANSLTIGATARPAACAKRPSPAVPSAAFPGCQAHSGRAAPCGVERSIASPPYRTWKDRAALR